jgi:hypothetical protein
VFGIVALGGVETARADVVYSFFVTTFDDPGASSTHAYGINDSGQIVGTYTDAPGHLVSWLRPQSFLSLARYRS